jgi:hypothetical protein
MQYYYIDGPIVEFDYRKYVNNPNYRSDPPILGMLNPKVEDNKEVATSTEEIIALYQSTFDLDATIAFDEVKKLTTEADRAFIVYVTKENDAYIDTSRGHIHKHFHHPRYALDEERRYIANERRTVSVIIPIKIVDPVTEMLRWTDFEFDFTTSKHERNQIKWIADNLKIDETNIQEVKMPDSGQYLILDFASSHNMHWIENAPGSNNEYLCLILDI